MLALREMAARCFAELGGREFAMDVPLFDSEWLDKSAGLQRSGASGGCSSAGTTLGFPGGSMRSAAELA
jgi:hypothetical protein